MREILLVALGGGVGAALRGAIDLLAARVGLTAPPATLAINLIGSFAAGLLVALVVERGALPAELRPLLIVGLLGGFTTFSAFAVQTLRLGEGAPLSALAYVAASLLLGLLSAAAGLAIGRAA
ncbi:MAG: CrcB family protein [Chloroflexi bacterium]|nr:MAG: CrcB family protein [Chloroflexota bacterium]RLT29956.1 MAG: CrcB family protein [Chloroflexota bacterium]